MLTTGTLSELFEESALASNKTESKHAKTTLFSERASPGVRPEEHASTHLAYEGTGAYSPATAALHDPMNPNPREVTS